jgi:hypothetical protein
VNQSKASTYKMQTFRDQPLLDHWPCFFVWFCFVFFKISQIKPSALNQQSPLQYENQKTTVFLLSQTESECSKRLEDMYLADARCQSCRVSRPLSSNPSFTPGMAFLSLRISLRLCELLCKVLCAHRVGELRGAGTHAALMGVHTSGLAAQTHGDTGTSAWTQLQKTNKQTNKQTRKHPHKHTGPKHN